MMKELLLLWAAVLSLGTVHAETAVPSGRIYDTAAKRDIQPETLAKKLAESDVVLIGEKHDDAAHHQAEYWLLKQTAENRKHGSVLLEMLDTDQRKDVSDVQQWLKEGGRTSERSLGRKMGWNEAWDWAAYSGVVNLIMRQPAKVLPANPPRTEVRKAASFVPSGKRSGNAEIRKSLGGIMGGSHGGTEGLVSMQQFKDYNMMKNVTAAPKPAWLLAGSIHVSKLLGVPLFLQDAGFSGRTSVLVLTDASSDIDTRHADYIWYLDMAQK